MRHGISISTRVSGAGVGGDCVMSGAAGSPLGAVFPAATAFDAGGFAGAAVLRAGFSARPQRRGRKAGGPDCVAPTATMAPAP